MASLEYRTWQEQQPPSPLATSNNNVALEYYTCIMYRIIDVPAPSTHVTSDNYTALEYYTFIDVPESSTHYRHGGLSGSALACGACKSC